MDIQRPNAESLAERLREENNIQVEVVDSPTEVLINSEVIVTASTSMHPVLPGNRDLLMGKTFIGVGSFKPEMREFPDELYPLLENVFIDSRQAVEESGDLYMALDAGLLRNEQVSTLGSYIDNPRAFRAGTTKFFKTVGMAIFDLLVAQKLFEKANILQKGVHIDFP